jgi:uncharacterized phage-associated protein
MEELKLAYCNECEDLVEYENENRFIVEQFKGTEIKYWFMIGKCKECGCEVATDIDYNHRKSLAQIKAYKKAKGIIDTDEITEIINKYNIGKESLASIAGFGKATVKRYYEGFIPAKEYSDVLYNLLNDENYFMKMVRKNKELLNDVTLRKINERYEILREIKNSKIAQIINYIVTELGEVTPLALQKLLFFSDGVNYALNGEQMICEEVQAWQHGPVYPDIYQKYKKYGYKPIDNVINSTHGCMLSLVSNEELKALNLVIRTFGLYSPKVLEKISHSQSPWVNKREGYDEKDSSCELIREDSIKEYFIKNELNSEENIMKHIYRILQG